MKVTISEAAAYLQNNQVVAIPTETVYGLAAYVGSQPAVEAIFQLKGRPRQNPLIVHVKSVDECLSFVTEKPPTLIYSQRPSGQDRLHLYYQ